MSVFFAGIVHVFLWILQKTFSNVQISPSLYSFQPFRAGAHLSHSDYVSQRLGGALRRIWTFLSTRRQPAGGEKVSARGNVQIMTRYAADIHPHRLW